MTFLQKCSCTLFWLTVFVGFIVSLDGLCFFVIDLSDHFGFGFTSLKLNLLQQ